MKNNKHVESFGEFNENLNISDIISSLLKEMSERLQYPETLEKSDENTGRVRRSSKFYFH